MYKLMRKEYAMQHKCAMLADYIIGWIRFG